MPLNSADYHLLIVSDLHLSEGRDEHTHHISRNEDFFYDEEFSRFLDYHVALDPARKWHLIINGDFCDFLQVLATEFDPEFLEYLGVKNESEARQLLNIRQQSTRFGFDAGPGETVFKLWRILDGHWIFALALIRFLEQGNIVSIGRGNHDPEFQYELVREHFRKMLVWFFANKREEPSHAHGVTRFEQVCAQQVQFLDWFYYEPGLIWAEHGGQYDEANSFPHWLAPYLPHSDHIEMPWGSFFVRYLFNSIEEEEPWADNIKPQSRFLQWFITRRPVLATRFIFGNGRYMLKKLAKAWRPLPGENSRDAEHKQRRAALEQQWGVPPGELAQLDEIQADSVLRNPHGVWKFAKLLTRGWRVSLAVLAYALITILVGMVLIVGQVIAPAMPLPIRHLIGTVAHMQGVSQLTVLLLSSRYFTFLYLLCALGYFISQLFPHKSTPSYLVPKAAYARAKLGVQYVTMGHTHDSDLSTLAGDGQYFNTGTWTRVIGDAEQLFSKESELVFLQVLRGDKVSCRLMRWYDGANEPRLVKLFSDENSNGSRDHISSQVAHSQ